MKILRNKNFSKKENKEKRDNKRSAAKIGATTLLGASGGIYFGADKAGENSRKKRIEIVSNYEKALEQRAKEIKAKGYDPAEVEVAKSLKFLTDADKLYKLANKEGNKAFNKTMLKATGIGAATGLGLGVANHVIAKNKKKKKLENTKK
jgi:predicted nucleic acid-binding protein